MVIREDLLIAFGADNIKLQRLDTLFKENDLPEYYFQIISGKIKLTNFQPEKREFIQSIHSSGESVGEIFLFSNHSYPASAVAMEDCTILRLNYRKLLKLLKSDFKIQMDFLHYLAERSYNSYIFLNSLTSEDAVQQLITLLNHLKNNGNTEPHSFQVPYTRKEIAFLTGLRIETVIRTFKKMESDKLIKIIKGRVYY